MNEYCSSVYQFCPSRYDRDWKCVPRPHGSAGRARLSGTMKLATILLFNHGAIHGQLVWESSVGDGRQSRCRSRGIALGLGEAGATVYVTGRTSRAGASPGGLGDTCKPLRMR